MQAADGVPGREGRLRENLCIQAKDLCFPCLLAAVDAGWAAAAETAVGHRFVDVVVAVVGVAARIAVAADVIIVASAGTAVAVVAVQGSAVGSAAGYAGVALTQR